MNKMNRKQRKDLFFGQLSNIDIGKNIISGLEIMIELPKFLTSLGIDPSQSEYYKLNGSSIQGNVKVAIDILSAAGIDPKTGAGSTYTFSNITNRYKKMISDKEKRSENLVKTAISVLIDNFVILIKQADDPKEMKLRIEVNLGHAISNKFANSRSGEMIHQESFAKLLLLFSKKYFGKAISDSNNYKAQKEKEKKRIYNSKYGGRNKYLDKEKYTPLGNGEFSSKELGMTFPVNKENFNIESNNSSMNNLLNELKNELKD